MAQRVTISIVADASQADAVISKLNSQLGNIGGNAFKAQVDSVNKLSDGMLRAVQISDQLVRTGYRLTLGLSAPIIAATSYVVKLYSELEVSRIAFTAFTGSVDLANQHLRNLYQFALSTPFNFSQVVQLSRYLQGVGFEAGQVIPLLKSVGNAIALLGGGNDEIERVVNQLVHIQTLSRVTLRELNPIARAGIPVFAELAEAIRKPGEAADETGRRLKNLIQKGLIPGPEFIKFFAAAQDVRFPGGLEKISDSIKISLSNLVDAAENAARVFGEALAPAIKLIISGLTSAVNILTKVGTLFGSLPEGVRVAVGFFIAFAAVIGPLVLSIGYFARSLVSLFQFFNKLNVVTNANTLATGESTVAANVASTAKLKEAEATAVLTGAIEKQTAAQAEQLALFNGPLNQLQYKGGPGYGPAYPGRDRFNQPKPNIPAKISAGQVGEQLAFGFGSSTFSANSAENITKEAVAAEKAAKGLGGLSGILGRLVGGFAAFVGISNLANISLKGFTTALGSIGSKVLAVAGPIGAFISGFYLLKTVVDYFKDVPVFKQFSQVLDFLDPFKNLGIIFTGIGNTIKSVLKDFGFLKDSAEELINRGGSVKDNPLLAQKRKAEAAKALLDSIELKQQEQNRITILRDQLEVQRTAREYAIDSEGKELKGLQLINAEIDKRLYKATVQTHTNALTGLPENFNVPLTPIAAVDFAKGDFSQLQKFQEANREETLKKSQEVDDEIFKNRISQLDDYSKDRISRLEALSSSELLLTSALEVQKRDIQLATLDQVNKAELAHIDVVQFREREAIGQKLKDLGTEDEARKAAQERAGKYTTDPAVQKQIVDAVLGYRFRAEAKLHADLKIADLTADEQRLVQAYNTARQEYEVRKTFAENYNKLAIELLNKERDTALSSLTETIQFQKNVINQRRDAELKNLEFRQPTSIRDELSIVRQQAGLRQEALKQNFDLEKIANDTLAKDRTRKDLEELKRRGANLQQLYDRAAQLNDVTNRESLQQQIAYFQEVNNIQRESALQQLQVIRANTISIFDSVRKASDTVLDQILTHSKSVFGAIGDAIKSAGITALKTIVSAQTSRLFTKLTTGQDVQFQASNLGTGPLASFGNVLSRLGFGKPIVQPNAQGTPLIVATDAKIAQLQAQYADLIKKQPARIELPPEPKLPTEEIAGINKGISDTLQFLKATFGDSSGIGYVESIDKHIEDIIKTLEANAKAFTPAQNDAIKNANDAALKGDDDTSLIDKALQGRSIQNLPGTLGDIVDKMQGVIVHKEAGAATTRLHNPGALTYNHQEGATPSNINVIPEKFRATLPPVYLAQFKTDEAGAAALQTQLLKYIDQNLTLNQLAEKYAPSSDPRNHPKEYAEELSKAIGVGVDVPLKDFIKQFGQITNILKSNIYIDTSPKAVSPYAITAPAQNQFAVPSVQNAVKDLINLVPSPASILHDEKPNIISQVLGELKQQVKEISNNPDAISSITKTPIYFVPGHEKDKISASYDEKNDLIRVYDPRDQATASLIHEDVHALLTKSHESIEALTNLLPVDTIKSAGDILKNRFDGYTTDLLRQKEIIPRLISGQGATLGIPQAQAENSIDTLVKALQDNGKGDLAAKLVQEHQGAANVPYGVPLSSGPYGYPSLADASGGILHDETPSSTGPQSFGSSANILPAISGLLGGASGGVITGAAVGALAGLPRLLIPTGAEKVKQKVKELYGVILDSKAAQELTDIINKTYKGNLTYALHQPEIVKWIQDYAVAAKQQFGARNNSLSFGTKFSELFGKSATGLLATGASLLSRFGFGQHSTSTPSASIVNDEKYIGSNIPGGGIPSLGITPTFSGQAEQLNTSSFSFPTQFPATSAPSLSGISGSIFSNISAAVGSPGSISNRIESLEPLPGYVQTSPTTGKLEGYGINQRGEVGMITGQDSSGGLFGAILNQATGTKAAGGLFSKAGLTGGLFSLGGVLGLGLLTSGAKSTGISSTARTVLGGGLLGLAAGHAGLLGTYGASGALAGSAALAAGAGIGAGAALVFDASKRHGLIGGIEGAGGGALAGATIGTFIFPGIGTAIGAAVGAIAGGLIGAFGPQTKTQQIIKAVKDTFGLKIDNGFAKQIQQVIDQKYGGSISRGIRTQEVLQLLELYAQATGQPFGIQNKVRSSTLIQTQSGLTQQAILEGNKALSFNGLPVYGGVATQNIEAPGHYSTGGILPYQGLPSAVFGSTAQPSSVDLGAPTSTAQANNGGGNIIIENKLPDSAVGDYLDGRTVRTIQASPTAVSKAQIAAYKNNVNRRESIRLQVNPGEILT